MTRWLGISGAMATLIISCSGAQRPDPDGVDDDHRGALDTGSADVAELTATNAETFIDRLEPASLELLSTKDEFLQTSAASIFSQAVLLLMTSKLTSAMVEISPSIGPRCPSIIEEGVKVSVVGACTDEEEVQWKGRVTVWDLEKIMKSSSSGVRTSAPQEEMPMLAAAEYSHFGSIEQRRCGTDMVESGSFFDGRVEVEQLDSKRTTFKIDLVVERMGVDSECQPAYSYALVYDGTVVNLEPSGLSTKDGSPLTRNTTWNGSGRIGWAHLGKVEVTTTDERLQHACATEPLSGTTALRAGGDVAVITYDGAASCDDPGTATWTLNDTYQGVISGVSCSSGATRPAEFGWPLGCAVVFMVVAMLRARAR